MSFTLVLLLAVSVALLGNVLLLGLPGAFYLSLATFLLRPLRWQGINDLGDQAWPLALLTTFLWGLGLIPSWLLVTYWTTWSIAWVWLVWAGWGIGLGVGLLTYQHFARNTHIGR